MVPYQTNHDCVYCVAVDLPQSLRVERLTNLVIANVHDSDRSPLI